MNKRIFGYMPSGEPVEEYTLTRGDFTACIITYGGAVRRFVAFGTDIVCGFDTLEGYLADTSHQGALVGRYANRIDYGRFTLDGKTYQLACNTGEGKVHLHGGNIGYSRKVWEVTDATDTRLCLRMTSPDGEEGYPGNVVVDVTYSLGERGLAIDYTAVTDAPTPINLTNHSYFNLEGCRGGSILGTSLTINAHAYSELNERMIPVRQVPVEGTPYDFRLPHTVGSRVHEAAGETYDNNFILTPCPPEEVDGFLLCPAACAVGEAIGMTVYTNQPCMQLYIGYFLTEDNPFRGGVAQAPHTTLCFETQTEPNGPARGEAILRPGEVYRHTTLYAPELL